jgi:hypothetical protein
MKAITVVIAFLIVSGFRSPAQQSHADVPQPGSGIHEMHHGHPAGVAISYAELKDTVAILDRARQATAKYQDVRAAQADGYQAIGPDVPGMGTHFVHTKNETAKANAGFDVEHPPILLYESNPSVAGGYLLVGVSYLLVAPEGPDGQPLNPPFPKSLATWHRHENICVLPDQSTPKGLTENQCRERGGHFTAETQWMVHAWIWKESPLGVFSSTNPDVR